MNMKELPLQNWDYAMGQEDWYPPILPALKDVTVEQALWKPEGQAANSIWENVRHLLYYKRRLLARLKERRFLMKESAMTRRFSFMTQVRGMEYGPGATSGCSCRFTTEDGRDDGGGDHRIAAPNT